MNENAYAPIIKKTIWLQVNLLLAMTVVTFIGEVGLFFFMEPRNMLEISSQAYAYKFVLLPSGSNFLFVAAGWGLYRWQKISLKLKQYVLSILMVCTAFMIALVHGVFPIIYQLFSIVIIFTVFYGNEKLTTLIFVMSVLGRIISTFFCIDVTVSFDQDVIGNMLIGIAILGAVYVLSRMIIRMENEKRMLILTNAHNWAEMKAAAGKDMLTGMYNRRSFAEFRIAVKKQERQNQPSFIAMWDVDNFKQINDSYGHLRGDDVLRYIGETCRASQCRMTCFRYGGDEFCAAIFEENLEQTMMHLERLQQQLGKYQTYEGERIPISISIGLAHYDRTESMDISVERADRALYQVKNMQKGKILLFKDGKGN